MNGDIWKRINEMLSDSRTLFSGNEFNNPESLGVIIRMCDSCLSSKASLNFTTKEKIFIELFKLFLQDRKVSAEK